MYAVIDIETTGRSAKGQKITEIAILIHDGKKVIDEYQTLINPETSIPYSITQLTGICDEMLVHAPKFFEVARKIYEMTEDHIFVAHNVAFDYGIIRSEFLNLGGEYERERMCTVKLSRQLLPGHQSYSLGKLCADLDIPIVGRHRAYGDAKATTTLLEILINKNKEFGEEKLTPYSKVQVPKIPPLLDVDIFKNLPKETGVYYFHDSKGKIIYVGKANNIRQRVLSHFNDKSLKERTMFEFIANITYELTGNELVALLHESAEIKRLMPQYNHAQKRKSETHGLYVYENQKGILQLAYGKINGSAMPILSFYTLGQAKRYVEQLVEKNSLCSKYTGLEKTNSSCFGYMIKRCKGICCEQETVQQYNERVEKVLSEMIIKNDDFFIEEKGRTEEECAIVQIKQGTYQGFGFIPKRELELSYESRHQYIVKKDHNSDTQRIIRSYLSKT